MLTAMAPRQGRADTNSLDFGTYLRYLRQRAGLSLRGLGNAIGVSFVYISQVERGAVPPPSADMIIRLAKALGVDPDELLVRAGKAPPDLVQRLSTDLEFVKRVRALTE